MRCEINKEDLTDDQLKNVEKAESIVQKAKVYLLLNQRFFGIIATRLSYIMTYDVPTMAVSSTTLWYNPDFVCTLSEAEVRGVLAHEILHVANQHSIRVLRKIPRLEIIENKIANKTATTDDLEFFKDHHLFWNMAADYSINDVLIESGFILPSGGLIPDVSQKNLSAEEHYNRLDKSKKPNSNKPNNSGGNGNNSGGNNSGGSGSNSGDNDGDDSDGGDNSNNSGGFNNFGEVVLDEDHDATGKCISQAERAKLQKVVGALVSYAASQAQKAGQLPSSLSIFVEKILRSEPTIEDWLASISSNVDDSDYSWQNPDVYSTYGCDVMLPTLLDHRVGDIIIYVDTSASISIAELRYANAVIRGFVQRFKMQATVCYFDAGIQNVVKLNSENFAIKEMNAKGRGGTLFAPIFEHFKKAIHDDNVAMLIITDLIPFDSPDAQVPLPLLWCQVGDNARWRPNYGDVIKIKVEE